MSFFGSLGRAVIDTVMLPVEVAKDVVTLGGVSVDEDEPYTWKRLKQLGQDVEDARESLD